MKTGETSFCGKRPVTNVLQDNVITSVSRRIDFDRQVERNSDIRSEDSLEFSEGKNFYFKGGNWDVGKGRQEIVRKGKVLENLTQ